MTRTVKIPLREDSPAANLESASRGRKAQSSPTKSRRSATPVRTQRSGGRTRRPSVTDLDARPLGDDADEDDWLRQRRSPRKRLTSRARKIAATLDTGTAAGTGAGAGGESVPKFETSSFDIREDTDVDEQAPPNEQDHDARSSKSSELRELNVNRLRTRTGDVLAKADAITKGIERTVVSDIAKPAITRVSPKSETTRKASARSAASYPTPSPTSSLHGNSDEIRPDHDVDQGGEQQDAGFDTIIESEAFTMIDLNTLPSARAYLNSPPQMADAGQTSKLSPSIARAANADLLKPNSHVDVQRSGHQRLDESDLSSTVPSSPPVVETDKSLLHIPSSSGSSSGILRKVTPEHYSSPTLPSPPQQPSRTAAPREHRRSASAVFAGIALQDVISPPHLKPVENKQPSVPLPQAREDVGPGRMAGADVGPQTEVHARWGFGEELAKRPKLAKDAARCAHARKQPQTQVWRGENLVQRTPVQVKEPKLGGQFHDALRTPRVSSLKRPDKTLLDTQARREREWQLEREAVSRAIQNASESQVVVIDSDDEDEAADNVPTQLPSAINVDISAMDDAVKHEEEEEDDIWLAEAKTSSSPEPKADQSIENNSQTLEQSHHGEQAAEVVSRPRTRRSLIPSPWMKGEDFPTSAEPSTFLSTRTDEMSGLLAYREPESHVKFGGDVTQRRLAQRRNSGKFDIDLMAGTPSTTELEDESTNMDGGDTDDATPTTLSRDDSPVAGEHEEVEDDTRDDAEDTVRAACAIQPMLVPVKFNDSSVAVSTPPPEPQQARRQPAVTASDLSSSPPRPPTPRSAMKGSRQSFGHFLEDTTTADTPTIVRRVIFSERSRGVDVNGLESSFSMKSGSTDDSTMAAGQVGEQLQRELWSHHHADVTTSTDSHLDEADEDDQDASGSADVEEEAHSTGAARASWASWFFGSKKADIASASLDQTGDEASVDTSRSVTDETVGHNEGWVETKSSIPSMSRGQVVAKTHLEERLPAANPRLKRPALVGRENASTHSSPTGLPSYLVAPSYPSDPRRSPHTPLAMSGSFTNSHFRTLHIIYRKSMRPRFHAPPPSQIRPAVQALRDATMVIDETEHGIETGEFEWMVGTGECEVLERFMQEVEFSNGWFQGRRVPVGTNMQEPKPVAEMRWGWSVEQLAEWLCRIVVGEVVREEEQKARDRRRLGATTRTSAARGRVGR